MLRVPLKFDNRATELTEAHQETLENVGNHIEDDRDLHYSICSKILRWELAGDIERNSSLGDDTT